MDQKIKKTIIDALMKVVDSAPTRNNWFSQQDVTEDSFNSWMNYVNSVFQITSQYLNTNSLFAIYSSIQTIAMQTNMDYVSKTNAICQRILDFARSILNL